ncbi:MAG TPA: T9SS type A sorting domain-containing protein [Chitinophagaceae bacterium]|nr:T9SS type A sorting domain-containing protein [Chitinophagaceae bacterium]
MSLLNLYWVLLLLPAVAGAQARLVLNGAKINIANGAQLVIDNPAADALTRYDGHIISEGENNAVKWNLGTATGTYTVPLGYGNTDYLPLRFTKDAGTGNGFFSFATYHTIWRNSDLLPTGVTNVTWNGQNNSSLIVDRFWKLAASNYTAKPTLTNLGFTYSETEIASPNNLTESTLEARRWNSLAQTWTDFVPNSVVNSSANTVTLSAVPSAQLQDWWLLVDNVQVLPLEGFQFTATTTPAAVRLNWQTTGETKGVVFTLERSADAFHFTALTHVAGVANGNAIQPYTYLDTKALWGKSYYRIKQTDAAGKIVYSPVRVVFRQADNSQFVVYPNPVTGGRFSIDLQRTELKNIQLVLINAAGALVFKQTVTDGNQYILVQLPAAVAPALYTVQITTSQGVLQQKLLVR